MGEAQAQLNVTTLRLKQKAHEFLATFTPLVHATVKNLINFQQQARARARVCRAV